MSYHLKQMVMFCIRTNSELAFGSQLQYRVYTRADNSFQTVQRADNSFQTVQRANNGLRLLTKCGIKSSVNNGETRCLCTEIWNCARASRNAGTRILVTLPLLPWLETPVSSYHCHPYPEHKLFFCCLYYSCVTTHKHQRLGFCCYPHHPHNVSCSIILERCSTNVALSIILEHCSTTLALNNISSQ